MRKKIVAITPVLCVIIYILVGLNHCWHPSWLIFFIVPIMPYLLGLKPLRGAYGTVVLFIFLELGFDHGMWHPTWLLFLTIPIFYILFPVKKKALEKPMFKRKIVITDVDEVNYVYHGE